MKIDLSTKNVAFWRTLAEGGFFFGVLVAPSVAVYTFGISLLIGRVHGIGAWIGMWRAGKLNWIYVSWMIIISIVISYWGLAVAPLIWLNFVTYALFAFHYFFDEYELQNRSHLIQNIVHSAAPFLIVSLYLVAYYFNIRVEHTLYLQIAVIFLGIEIFFTEVYNWSSLSFE